MKVILNKTRRSSDRYTLISGSMGSHGEPRSNSPNHKFKIANGVDRGNGYQGYMAVNYALGEDSYLSDGIKNKIKQTLKLLGYNL